MAGRVAELRGIVKPETMAGTVVELYTKWFDQRRPWIEQQLEKRNFLFATDTQSTTNSKLPWKNTTTLPKLTQIRDNLHANYMSALFPNDNWLRWEAYTEDSITKSKRQTIEAYMLNKLRQQKFEITVSQLLLDYIDYGNAISDVIYVNESKQDPKTGELIAGYVGPKAVRISPYDLVFNPLASSFKKSPKIVRTVKNVGEFFQEIEDNPEQGWLRDKLAKLKAIRNTVGAYSVQDFDKAVAYSVDGFGDMKEYYQSQFVEVLEFYGDFYDTEEGTLHRNKIITVADRNTVLRIVDNPSWLMNDTMEHVGWRLRPDNLYAMGPLDNLIGMQYRIDHLENAKADAIDLNILPPLKIKGEVKDFMWGPLAEIHIDENGDVQPMAPNLSALNIDNEIMFIMNMMEELAGAPKQAMGIRTPGEKTAFEVQSLQNAAGRIFQEKLRNFEVNLLEPLLNSMLEVARRNLDGADLIRVVDDDLAVVEFLKVTKQDITAAGKLRPVGSKHFASQAQLLQNLATLSNSPILQLVSPHLSRKRLATVVEDALNLERYKLFITNIGAAEDLETQQVLQQGQQILNESNQQVPPEPVPE